jgi:type I restriction enzyme, S subunit
VNELVSLSECCTFIKDGTHGSPARTPAGIPVLSAAHVRDGRLHFDSDRFTSEEELLTFQKRLKPAPGDVLLTIVGTIGRTAIVDQDRPFVFQRSVCVLRPKKHVLISTYLKSALESEAVKSQFHVEKHEVAQAGIYLDALNEIKIPLPPLSEQERITTLLDRADQLRRTRRYALELTDSFLPAAFLKLFGDPEKNPLGWSECELGELCEEVLDCPHSTPIYTATRTPHPCVRSSDIQQGFLDFSEAKYVSQSEYKKRIARGKPLPGDVIYCREGARFGNAGRIIDKTEMCLGQRTMLFRANSKVAVGEYIWAFLSSRAAYRQATRALDGSASPHVNVGEIVTFRVPLPPLSLQKVFASMCEQVDQLRALQRESLRQAEHLFASLLDRAFSG